MSALVVNALSKSFGGLHVTRDVHLNIEPGERRLIIGPNGAGKTTLFNCISGFYRPTSGDILIDDTAIGGMPSHLVARHGLVRTFQNIRVFKTMTVVENLLVAQHTQLSTGLLAGLFKLPDYRRSEREALDRAAYWLDQLGLRALANREAGTLSYGHQRRLEIARCMITKPRLLLLDEPAAGLNPQEKQELQQLIDRLRREHDVAVLLIEHDMSLIMGISDRILVMEYGKPIVTGTPSEVRNDARVIKAYLGEE
jgi:branched-chain amino acid transport system ATP-binding protein